MLNIRNISAIAKRSGGGGQEMATFPGRLGEAKEDAYRV